MIRYIVNSIHHDDFEDDVVNEDNIVSAEYYSRDKIDVKNAFRLAANEFVQTEKGLRALDNTLGYFKWADAFYGLPEPYLNKNGVFVSTNDEITQEIIINVDSDESLIA